MENITESNKIIAEFLEWNKGENYSDEFQFYEAFGESVYQTTPSEMKFHSDWNWLMKVVEKIHSMQSYGVLINPNGTYIQDEDDKVICMTFKNEEVNGEIISSSNIEATFNCCAEFIKWYNEQK